MTYHVCEKGERRSLYDARGIFCAYVCDKCETEKRARYRPEIFEDSNYACDEAIDED
jgi:hypothetical protein